MVISRGKEKKNLHLFVYSFYFFQIKGEHGFLPESSIYGIS